MIASSLFSFHESSERDPKHLRQCLVIPEDQSKILHDLPEWSPKRRSKENNASTLGLEKESEYTLNSQSIIRESQVSQNNLKGNQDYYVKNIDLFNKYTQNRKKILWAYDLHTRKRCKSLSLIETGKINKDLPSSVSLQRTLSFNDINRSSEILYPNFDKSVSLNKTYTLPQLSLDYKGKSNPKISENTTKKLLDKDSINVPEHQSSEEISNKQNKVMEVVTQLPIIISTSVQKDINEGGFHVVQEKQDISSTCHIVVVADKLSESCNGKINLANKESDSLQQVNGENSNQIAHPCSVATPSCDKESNSCSKQAVSENKISDDNHSTLSLDSNKLVEKLQVPLENIESSKDFPAEKMISEINSSFNYPSDTCKSSMLNVEIEGKTATLMEVGVNSISATKLESVETPVAIKRKSASKGSSKKRRSLQEKHGHHNIRSIQRAGEICYPSEQIEVMLNIVKQFL